MGGERESSSSRSSSGSGSSSNSSSSKVVGVEGGVWVGIDRYDNDGVRSDAKYTVLFLLTIPKGREPHPGDGYGEFYYWRQYESYDTGSCHTPVLYGACAGDLLAPKSRFHLSISDRRLNSTLSPH